MTIDKFELLALQKLALVCAALGESLKDARARDEQKALTKVLVDVCIRAELEKLENDECPAPTGRGGRRT